MAAMQASNDVRYLVFRMSVAMEEMRSFIADQYDGYEGGWSLCENSDEVDDLLKEAAASIGGE